MNKPALLFLATSAAACNVVSPAQNPRALAASVPIEKTPRHPEKSPAGEPAQASSQSPAQASAQHPATNETRERINNVCGSGETFSDCESESTALFNEVSKLLPAAAMQNCRGESYGEILCAERAFEANLKGDPTFEFYRQTKARCAQIVSQCREGHLTQSGQKP